MWKLSILFLTIGINFSWFFLKNLSHIVMDLDLGFLSPNPDRRKNPDPKHALPANSMVIRKVFFYISVLYSFRKFK